MILLLAEVVGFEPTDPFEPSVFKTAALSHAQPYFHKFLLAGPERFELPTPGFEDQHSSTELRTDNW